MSAQIRIILSGIMIVSGTFCAGVGLLGVYRFRYVMNRMQCAGIIDTLSLTLIFLGLALYRLDWDFSFKLILIAAFQWISAPLSSHLLAGMEAQADDGKGEHFRAVDETEIGGNGNGLS